MSSIGRSGGVRSCKLLCEEIILVRYASLIIGVERVIVEDDFHEVGNGFSAVSEVMFVSITVVTNLDWFLSFPFRTVQIVVWWGTSSAWWLKISTWRAQTVMWKVTGAVVESKNRVYIFPVGIHHHSSWKWAARDDSGHLLLETQSMWAEGRSSFCYLVEGSYRYYQYVLSSLWCVAPARSYGFCIGIFYGGYAYERDIKNPSSLAHEMTGSNFNMMRGCSRRNVEMIGLIASWNPATKTKSFSKSVWTCLQR